MKRAGLGKNLSALLATSRSSPAPLDVSSENISKLALELLKPGKYQPRRIISEESLQELASSIKIQGILQPILVRKVADTEKYEIIAGERRYAHLFSQGLRKYPFWCAKSTMLPPWHSP